MRCSSAQDQASKESIIVTSPKSVINVLEIYPDTSDKHRSQTVNRKGLMDYSSVLTAKRTTDSVNCTISLTQKESEVEEMNARTFLNINAKLWSIAIPSVSSQLCLLLVETISMIFVGRLNNVFAIAGVGLAIIFVNFSTVTLYGLNSAMSVLIAVAYGCNDIENCERIFQRGRVICLMATIPISVVNIFCRDILIGCGVEEEVADYA